MKKTFLAAAFFGLTCAPLPLHADTAPPDTPLVLPFGNDTTAEDKPELHPTTPEPSLGDYCDHSPFSA